MFHIKTLNPIAASGLQQFPSELYQVNTPGPADAILVRSHAMHDYVFDNHVKVVGRAGVGVNNIPIARCTELGIPVLYTPGANANAVRELVMAGMLLASRHIFPAWHYMNQLNQFTENNKLAAEIEKNKKQFVGRELQGKTLAVLGLGNIGVKVANTAHHFGMKVMGYDPEITVNRAWELSASVYQAKSMEELLRSADYISFHVPLTTATRGLINAERLRLMKKGVVLVNFARDGIIDEGAVLHALTENQVSAYVTDFPSTALMAHPKVISLPHLGASTCEAEENCAILIAQAVRAFLEYGVISYAVNFPTVELPHHFNTRLIVVNANVPNMVAQMSAVLAQAQVNIISLINQSKDALAYTVIDVAEPINATLLQHIKAIAGVISIRCLSSIKK